VAWSQEKLPILYWRGGREASYAKDPEYLRRKAKNLREYRRRLKLRNTEW
jgi:hypothetical protein